MNSWTNVESPPSATEVMGSVVRLDGTLRSVLVVEDSPEQALLTKQQLIAELGPETEVRLCETLERATEELRCSRPDCVLLDLSLPDGDGLEAVGVTMFAAPQVPIVVLSGRDDEALAVQAVQEGAQDYLVKHRADGPLIARAVRYAVERKRSELELARQAFTDSLTGLPNRALLVDRLALALARVERSGDRVAVLFVDLDRFKIVNDSLGHEAGDEVLRMVAKRLGTAVRPSDTVVRFGGDEFVVLCDDLVADEHAEHVAARIREELHKPLLLREREFVVEASIGIAIGAGRGIRPEELIRAADRAMFRAKQRGSPWEVSDGAEGAIAGARLDIQAELRRALERGEFELHYQPQVELASGRVGGVEALVRWRHPKRGLVPPAEFIGEAEESGLIVPIGEWVLVEACRQLALWRTAELCDQQLTMSVNLSPRQLADRRLISLIDDSIHGNGIAPERLCLEITESTVTADPALAERTLAEIRELGARLAIDDFGTGQSSLAMLDRHPLDVIKIDRSFVSALGDGLRPRRLFGAVVGVARALGLEAVAEGIERREQLDVVAQVGCDSAQGFLLARPAPSATIGPSLALPLPAALA